MVRQTQVLLVDDLDGSTGDETVKFSLDGTSYEIDLSAKNAAKMRKVFGVYVENARKLRKAGRQRPTRDLVAVRAWAKENGYPVADRGRVPGHIVAAYDEAK